MRCGAPRRRPVGADEVLILSGDTPLLTTGLLQALLATHRSHGRRRNRALVSSRTTSGATGESCVMPAATSSRSSRRAMRQPSSSRSARRTPRSTSSAATCSGRRSGACSPSTARASST
jgi:hypothetical protein